MIYKEHVIELFVNGKMMDLESQKSLNLRFNNVLYNPEKITSTQAEYSFEFELPSTPNNDKVFDYANNLSKLNKFHQRFNAEVYADGSIIFQGSLTLNGFKDNKYSCNLVSVKIYSLEDIFGDDKLSDIEWEIPFDGAGTTGKTIDYYNEHPENGVMFPLISYGAFQKSPYRRDEISEYTSKFDLDEYNRWYVESFYPSLNMLETIKKVFNYKGYTVGGDVFNNVLLKDIFMSCNLANEQQPSYNIGNPKFGKVGLTASFSSSGKTAYEQELNFPYFKVYNFVISGNTVTPYEEYNLSSVDMYNILYDGDVNVNAPTYMYQPNEGVIVIPESGFYKITMNVTTNLISTGYINVPQYVFDFLFSKFEQKNINLPVGLMENTPVEVALVRNYEDNYELIKGRYNKRYWTGDPTKESYIHGDNIVEWETCFPHEDPYNSQLPTKTNGLQLVHKSSSTNSHTYGGRRSSSTVSGVASNGNSHHKYTDRNYSSNMLGYVNFYNKIMAYDQAVSDCFICGFSSFYNGTASVMKNGYSWTPSSSVENHSFYPESGYMKMEKNSSGNTVYTITDFNKNEYLGSPNPTINVNNTGTQMNGKLSCMVYLNKNDVLELMEFHRNYSGVEYFTRTNVSLTIEAASPRQYYELVNDNYGYNSPTEFDVNLHLNNFLNNEKKASEWLQNIFDAYNLEMVQEGKSVFINSKKKFNFNNFSNAVNIDDRVNSSDVESSKINYPKSMSVRYKIDTDEWGFEKSVYPPEKLNYPDWKDYGDSGYTVITLSDDEYETSKSDKSLQFSYTWYDNFNWYKVNSDFVKDSGATPVTLRIPVISKYTYMIDGYDYEESMKHDGYGLSQRFWFKPSETNAYVWTRTYPAEKVKIYKTSNVWQNQDTSLNLSYKITEPSLLQQFFNITPYLASNYVIVDAYLTADEYKMIKNGSMVKFDSDLYLPVEISGFDPSGNNPTEIKMMKKVT